MYSKCQRSVSSERGASNLEYVVMLSVFAVALLVIISLTRQDLGQSFAVASAAAGGSLSGMCDEDNSDDGIYGELGNNVCQDIGGPPLGGDATP